MCGLVGIVELHNSRIDRHVLRRMADTINHRGPDGEGYFVDGGIGIGHKRLAIIDLTTGQQPMTVDGVTIAFNGEIYNYLELRDELIGRGCIFRTTSDTEVLLRLYIEDGVAAIRRLNGMFAFLIFDSNRRRVVVARDHFGIKPLYVHRSGDRVLFASEIKALLVHPAVSAAVDPQSLDDYLTLQYTLGEPTLFKGIRKVLPAHFEVLELGSGSLTKTRYWQPTYEVEVHASETESIEQLQALLKDSVRLQMRSDVPVGAYLSGGLDSSTVTMLAARQSSNSLKVFTGAFREGKEFDETEYAAEVAAQCGAEMLVAYPSEDEFIDSLPLLAYHMDEPAAGPGLFPQFIVSRLAARHVKACLGGQGGDEIFGGYARYVVNYFEQALKAAIFESNDECGLGLPLEDLAPNLPYIRQYVPLMTRFMKDGMFQSDDRRYFAIMDRSEGALDAYSREFRGHYNREGVFARFRTLYDSANTPSYFNRMLNYDMLTGLPSLLQVEDRVSMAVSLESRVPLLDYRIVDLIAKLPPALKFKGGEMKYLFKRAVRDLLPPKVLARKDKMGFPVPLQHWARGRARDFFHDILLSQRARQRGLFDGAAVEKLIAQESSFSRVLWGMLQLELWHRTFIDSKSSVQELP